MSSLENHFYIYILLLYVCERFAFVYVCTAHEYLVPTELAEGVRSSDNVSRYVGAENQIRKSSDAEPSLQP